MNIKEIKEVFADEAFVKGLFELETAAEVQTALKEKGIELTEEEIFAIREMFLKVADGKISAEQLEQWAVQAESGELPDELLEQVSGGVITLLGAIGIGIACIAGATAIGMAFDELIYTCTGRHW